MPLTGELGTELIETRQHPVEELTVENELSIFPPRFECRFPIFPPRFEFRFPIFPPRFECRFPIFPPRFECRFPIFSPRFECGVSVSASHFSLTTPVVSSWSYYERKISDFSPWSRTTSFSTRVRVLWAGLVTGWCGWLCCCFFNPLRPWFYRNFYRWYSSTQRWFSSWWDFFGSFICSCCFLEKITIFPENNENNDHRKCLYKIIEFRSHL